MTKRKHKSHNYTEGEIIYKRWFRTDVMLKEFDALTNVQKRIKLCNNLGICQSQGIKMTEPNHIISWSTADKYATKLRLSSLYDMA